MLAKLERSDRLALWEQEMQTTYSVPFLKGPFQLAGVQWTSITKYHRGGVPTMNLPKRAVF